MDGWIYGRLGIWVTVGEHCRNLCCFHLFLKFLSDIGLINLLQPELELFEKSLGFGTATHGGRTSCIHRHLQNPRSIWPADGIWGLILLAVRALTALQAYSTGRLCRSGYHVGRAGVGCGLLDLVGQLGQLFMKIVRALALIFNSFSFIHRLPTKVSTWTQQAFS